MTRLDYVLVIIDIVIGTLVLFASAAVVLYYSRVLRVARGKYGLLLWHIVTIAGSVSGTWLMIVLAQFDNALIFDTPLWIRLVGYALFGTTTVTAIGIIALTQYRRVRSTEPTTTVEVTTHHGVSVESSDSDGPRADRWRRG